MDDPSDKNVQKSLLVCVNYRFQLDKPSCRANGSRELLRAFRDGIHKRGLDIKVEESICLGQCEFGPTVRLAPGGDFFLKTGLDDIDAILDQLQHTTK